MTIAAVDGGTYFHHHTLSEPPFSTFIDRLIYIRDLPFADLSDCRALLLPCRLNAHLIAPLADLLKDYMRGGGTLVAMGETFPDRWLSGISFTPCETNFWWWIEGTRGPAPKIAAPQHPLLAGMTEAAATWHLHGHFHLTDAQQPLIDEGPGTLMFEDVETYAPGRLVAMTLDPCYHHGSNFMPATTEFLTAFLPALKASV